MSLIQRQIFTDQEVALLLQSADIIKRARIADGLSQRPASIQPIPLDLSVEKLASQPYKVNFPFTSVYVQDTTTESVEIFMRPGSDDSNQGSIKLRRGDVFTSENPIPNAYLHWAPQIGLSATLIFFVDSKFESGSQITSLSGGVNLSDGSILGGPQKITLAATTATEIIPASATNIVTTLQNKTGGDLWIGDSSVSNTGATEGIKIPNDGIIYWRNQAALFGYSVAGGSITYMRER